MNIPSIGSNLEVSGYTAVQCTGNIENDAQTFAEANGISVEEAEAVLQSNYDMSAVEQINNNSEISEVTQETPDEDSVLNNVPTSGMHNFSFGLTEEQKSTIESACNNFIGALEYVESLYQSIESNPEDMSMQQSFMDAMSAVETAAQELASTIQEVEQESYMNMFNNPYNLFMQAMGNQNEVNAMYAQGQGSFEDVVTSYSATAYASSLLLEAMSQFEFVQ